MHDRLVTRAKSATPLDAVTTSGLDAWLKKQSDADAQWARGAGFAAREGELLLFASPAGELKSAALGLGMQGDPLALAAFPESLPEGTYFFRNVPPELGGARGALAWLLGTYSFDRYKKHDRRMHKLLLAADVDQAEVERIAAGVFLARNLVNTPANDMGPAELAEAARALAKKFGAKFRVIVGDELIEKNYPLVHAVGRASERAPRLIDFRWGDEAAPRVTLVGKGVCFDSGGLDLKNSAGMLTMKKDMGGAAVVLGLAHMVMDAGLPVRLRVLIPAVENSVSGRAYRPGDVLASRKGLTIEIGNTDAEGRLVLADALSEADEESPELLIDFATLTGAARAATGMELPPFFTDDEALAGDLSRAAAEVHDPVWRLPLWRGYESAIASPVADLNNSPDYSLAGAITAGLFLNRFVSRARSWVHLDIPAWIDRPRPGRRRGAEANGARACYALLSTRYPKTGARSKARKRK
ncbi:MAG TPA: leucyl aminopeptidase family protein [Rhizomicrobium sp.]|jgi:leucyl aminopeptidase|nr:leucyl aminopeptidase family protein [Rhizomicrobium sp.]